MLCRICTGSEAGPGHLEWPKATRPERSRLVSELTRCNFCQLQDMRERALKNGVTLVIEPADARSEMRGWISVRYSDQKEPSGYFWELTNRCVC
jgi:hypothetical protein